MTKGRAQSWTCTRTEVTGLNLKCLGAACSGQSQHSARYEIQVGALVARTECVMRQRWQVFAMANLHCISAKQTG